MQTVLGAIPVPSLASMWLPRSHCHSDKGDEPAAKILNRLTTNVAYGSAPISSQQRLNVYDSTVEGDVLANLREHCVHDLWQRMSSYEESATDGSAILLLAQSFAI